MIQIFISILGLAIGSFLNVCIYRIPREDLSIYSPRHSFCPECNESIAIYDNIPLLSYLILRGKCRKCKTKISVIYPLVEVATAILFLVMYYKVYIFVEPDETGTSLTGKPFELIHALIFVSVLIPIFVIDAQHLIIPNTISIVGLSLGIVIVGLTAYYSQDLDYLRDRLIGFVLGGLSLGLIAIVGRAIMRKKAMGMGDVKLMALIGLYLGALPALPLVIGLSAFGGALIGTVLISTGKKTRQSPIPYGPFIAGAAVLVLLWGDVLWEKYLQLAGWN